MKPFAGAAAIIPCLNEERTIGPLVAALRQRLEAVYVVDDASADASGAIARAAGAEVIRHERSLGKGAALRRGFAAAARRGFDWALSLDGDGQHSPEDLPRFFEAAAAEPCPSLVVGNRMGSADQMPALRRWVNRWMSARLSRLAGCPLPDTQCGYRLLRLRDWNGAGFRGDHFEFESELLIRFLREGRGVRFVPITTIYAGERSKIRPCVDAVRWFRWFFGVSRPPVRPSALPVGEPAFEQL